MNNNARLKNEIIDSLYKIMCTATSTVSDSRVENNDYFKRRVLGFKAEQEFRKFCKQKNITFLEGGQFLFKIISGEETDLNRFLYTTLSFEDPDEYVDLYGIISQWSDMDVLYYIKIIEKKDLKYTKFVIKNSSQSKPSETKIIKPEFEFYVFDKNNKKFKLAEEQGFDLVLKHFGVRTRTMPKFPLRKKEQFDYFNEYDLNVLSGIYATRYFMDLVLREAQGRLILDSDGFIKIRNRFVMIEIKEKAPINTSFPDNKAKWRYGWDTRRILWYLYITHKINIDVLYCVREIDNREQRNFLNWKAVLIDKFLSGNSWSFGRSGGGGEDTTLSPYLFFSELSVLLDSLS